MSVSPIVGTPARPPRVLGYSLILGLVFAAAWLGFTAVRARDGRMPITDWLDPMLAGSTLLVTLGAMAALIALWPQVPATRWRTVVVALLITTEWVYLTGEILSNTLTVGEPPSDVGSLLEISAGAVAGVALIVAAVALSGPAWRQNRPATAAVTLAALLLALGMTWWFTHPIDQSAPGAPACIPGNPLYNTFHRASC
ncbi:hypothetical protein [Streptosporangium sp. KLBMP 9127]|nr:hypothetical protein [Streptosporangium sp. KLBMP 9127]